MYQVNTRADVLLRVSVVFSAVTLVLSCLLFAQLHQRDSEIAALRSIVNGTTEQGGAEPKPVTPAQTRTRLHLVSTLPAVLATFARPR